MLKPVAVIAPLVVVPILAANRPGRFGAERRAGAYFAKRRGLRLIGMDKMAGKDFEARLIDPQTLSGR